MESLGRTSSFGVVLLVRPEAVLDPLGRAHELEHMAVGVVEPPELGVVVERRRAVGGEACRTVRRLRTGRGEAEGVLVLEELAAARGA